MVREDAAGEISGLEITDLDGDGLTDLVVFRRPQTGMLGDEDAAISGEALEPGEATVLICFEKQRQALAPAQEDPIAKLRKGARRTP